MASTPVFADTMRSPRAVSRRVTVGASLLALACVLGLVEASLPGLPMAPWLRLGLANIAVVIALALYGPALAAVVSTGRVLIVALATGSLATPAFAMAFAGAAASLLVMWLLSACAKALSPVGWSAAGSVAHVLAQFGAAAVLLGSGALLMLAPVSALLALALGVVTGSLARLLLSRLPA